MSPQLLGIVPSNSGGFGDPEKATKVYARNELEPMQTRFLGLNQLLGEEVITFKPYTIEAPAAA